MLKTKYEYNFYSFYDHTGMEQHFEKMAAQGWLIEKLGYFWRYRRIGPQALRFSVVYYSEASEFDPTKPSLEDSCRRAHILCYRCWRSWCW